MNQSKLKVVKLEMARVNIDILGISQLKWTGMCGFSTPAAAKSLQPCPTLCDPIGGSPPGSPCPWDFPGKITGVGCHCLLQDLTQMTIISNTVDKNPLEEIK